MSIDLKKYNEKRDFEKTTEPKGKVEKPKQKNTALKFFVQHHIARNDHFDLRLEWNGVLLSWAVPKGPSFDPTEKRLAVQVEDHPIDYGNFEGTIPEGEYGAGTVMVWDKGVWQAVSDVEEGLKKGSLKFVLSGERLSGGWTLVKFKTKGNNEEKEQKNWLLIKENDEFASNINVSNFSTSVKTGRTMSQIEKNKK